MGVKASKPTVTGSDTFVEKPIMTTERPSATVPADTLLKKDETTVTVQSISLSDEPSPVTPKDEVAQQDIPIVDAAKAPVAAAVVPASSETVQAGSIEELPKKIDIEEYKKGLSFDPAEIKRRYLEERDKRLRKDGNQQYREVKHDFKHYLEDPYTPFVARDPLDITTEFLVLGGGYGGLLIAARLVEQGVTDLKILDKAGDFGGTWYWNRYPGAACDIGT